MKNARVFALAATGLLLTGSCLQAQQASEPLSTALAEASPVSAGAATATLEERIAAARSVRVMDSILGIELGSELDEAHEKLDPLSAPGTPPKEEGGEEEKGRDKEDAAGAKPGRADSDEGEGHKVLWQLAGTEYSAIYITADDRERILSITGILRSGKEMPFDQVGEVAKAPVHDDQAIVWDVLRTGRPLCRVLAKGAQGKASTITLFVASRPSAFDSHRSVEKSGSKVD